MHHATWRRRWAESPGRSASSFSWVDGVLALQQVFADEELQGAGDQPLVKVAQGTVEGHDSGLFAVADWVAGDASPAQRESRGEFPIP